MVVVGFVMFVIIIVQEYAHSINRTINMEKKCFMKYSYYQCGQELVFLPDDFHLLINCLLASVLTWHL